MRSFLMIGWILQCFKKENEDKHWRTDLSEMQKCTYSQSRSSESRRWRQVFSGYVETPFHQGRWECFSLEILQIYSSNDSKHWHCRLDRQVFFAPKRLTDAWMDMSPLSVMSSERRESQCMAGMTHLNAERRNRKLKRPCTLMNKRPETTGTQHMWLPTEVYSHSMITGQHWCSLLQVI